MLGLIARWMRSEREPAPIDREWLIPEGRRVYAIGDIHGRLDLLRTLMAQIDRDDAARGAARTEIIFLGDLVDRGPDSAGVIDYLIAARASGRDCTFLGGNHDEVFLHAAEGDRKAAAGLHRMGGRETALSYGISEAEYEEGGFDALATLLRERVPAEHIAFLRALGEWHRVGDYVFVHAGIRPGRAMEEQRGDDLRWIRAGFLEHERCHGAMIVHGHTITDEPDFRTNRIGIDTGAFRTGRLTALGLEGGERWLLATPAEDADPA
jgi:serine/threonine protein phosphatase 1